VTAGAGLVLGLNGFIAAILGGFDKLGLTLVGGFLVALVETTFARFVDAAQSSTVVFALLIVLLIVRPQGLTRKVAADRV
jgi:branched-chain amino acid transport system permease protein